MKIEGEKTENKPGELSPFLDLAPKQGATTWNDLSGPSKPLELSLEAPNRQEQPEMNSVEASAPAELPEAILDLPEEPAEENFAAQYIEQPGQPQQKPLERVLGVDAPKEPAPTDDLQDFVASHMEQPSKPLEPVLDQKNKQEMDAANRGPASSLPNEILG